MDRENRIIEAAKAFLPFMNQEFLISLTNKGIYNRSGKDLEKIRDSILMDITEDGHIQVKQDGDITVTLNSNIQNSTCSCPSQSICKHIIISILYLKEYYEAHKDEAGEVSTKEEEQIEETPKEAVEEYIDLKSLTKEKVAEFLGKKDYNALVHSLQVKNEAEFQYGDLLTVTLQNKNIKVYFPKENSIQNAMCSCKEKGICTHKKYALAAYAMIELKLPLTSEEVGIQIGEAEQEFLERLKEMVSDMMDAGLSSMTGSEIKQLENFYIMAYGMKFFALASDLKSLSGDLNFYFSKNVSFSTKRTLHTLCVIYNRAVSLLQNKENVQKVSVLAGKRREESFILDNIHTIGLGTVSRITKRKDLLLNAYLYCEELNKIVVLSTLRPSENGTTPDMLYNIGLVWADELTFRSVSTAKYLLQEARFSGDKISTTKSTSSSRKGETEEKDIASFAIENYEVLKDKLKNKPFQYFEPYSEAASVYLLKVERMDKMEFDKIEQKLKFFVFDKNENSVQFEIRYSGVTEGAIKYLERRNTEKTMFQYILGSISDKGGALKGTYLSCFSEGKVKNIFFKEK